MIAPAKAGCPLCTTDARVVLGSDAFTMLRCRGCGVDFAEYGQRDVTGGEDHFTNLDRQRYDRSVGLARRRSFEKLVRRVSQYVDEGTWLDIGCSFGWLLQYVQERGYRPLGIEPSYSAAAEVQAAGLEVIEGYFPETLPEDVNCDVASLIDVLEHMEDPIRVLTQLRQRLNPGGVVLIQVPDQSCLLYRTAELLARRTGGRVDFAIRRLWLTDLDFPHRYYFTRRCLRSLLDECGFELLADWRSSIGSPWAALDRVRYYEQNSKSSTAVGLAVGAINAVDALIGHGGLLTLIAQPREVAV